MATLADTTGRLLELCSEADGPDDACWKNQPFRFGIPYPFFFLDTSHDEYLAIRAAGVAGFVQLVARAKERKVCLDAVHTA